MSIAAEDMSHDGFQDKRVRKPKKRERQKGKKIIKSETCTKCPGTGWYTAPNQRGTIHSVVCDACCPHDQGLLVIKR